MLSLLQHIRVRDAVCTPVFLMDGKTESNICRDRLLIELFSISREITQDNEKQRSVVQCWGNSLEHGQHGEKSHNALECVIRVGVSVITKSSFDS